MAKTETANSSRVMKPATGMGDSNLNYVRPSKLAEAGITGLVASGIYAGTVQNELYDRQDYKLEGEDGKTTIINSAGNLKYQMDAVQPGQYVEIMYSGKNEITKGPRKGKQAHTFKVLVAE